MGGLGWRTKSIAIIPTYIPEDKMAQLSFTVMMLTFLNALILLLDLDPAYPRVCNLLINGKSCLLSVNGKSMLYHIFHII